MGEYRHTGAGREPELLPEELRRMTGTELGTEQLPEDPLAEAGAYRQGHPFPQEQLRIPVREPEAPQEAVCAEEPEPPQPSIRAYNNDFADKGMQHTRRKQTQAQRAAQAQLLREARLERQLREEQEAQLQRELLRQEADGEETEPEPPRRKRRGCGCLIWLILVMALLAALAFGAVRLLGRLPAPAAQERRSGVSTVLLAGVDADGLRTDTLMLVDIDREENRYHILSIPRDTLTWGDYNVPKINGAYGFYGCGEAGMDALLALVEDCVGFRPDRYLLLDFRAVSELVDIMGGIECEVPMDMEVEGVTLRQGLQRLDGRQTLALLRFRSGYAMADLQRVEVQRQVISAAMEQWISLKSLPRLQEAVSCVTEHMLTDLTVLHMASLALDLRGCEAGETVTLPGEAKMIGGGSYYVLDPEQVAAVINAYFNPYERDITVEDLHIKVG